MQSRLITNLFTAFFFPILLLFEAIKAKSFAYQRWLLTLFITIYGATIQLSVSNDGYRHRQKVYDHYVDLRFQDWLSELINILTFQVNASGAQDVYNHVFSYLCFLPLIILFILLM